MKFLIALAFLFSSLCAADEGFMGYGLGVGNSAKNTKTETKIFHLGFREEMWNGIYWENKVGFWGDGSGDPNRSSSGYVSSGLGLEVDLSPVVLRSGWNLAAITTPDGYLGGRFPQFNGNLYVGVRDRHGNGIGFQYEHISSAGLLKPNEGRDFLVLQISQKW